MRPSGHRTRDERGPAGDWTSVQQLDGSSLVAALRGRALHRLTFAGSDVTAEQVLFGGDYGRLRASVEGPHRALYVTTSNPTAAAIPARGEDRTPRIVPPAA